MELRNFTLLALRIILAIILLINGLNKFFNFIPVNYASAESVQMIEGLLAVGYFFKLLGVLELLIALFLLIPQLVPIALLMLLPISVNAFLFHVFTDKGQLGMSAAVFVLNVYIALSYIPYFKLLIVRRSNTNQ